MPCWWGRGGLAPKQTLGPHWSWLWPLSGPGLWSKMLPQIPRGGPYRGGILFKAVTARQALCRREGMTDRSPPSTPSPAPLSARTQARAHKHPWKGKYCPGAWGQSRALGQPQGRVKPGKGCAPPHNNRVVAVKWGGQSLAGVFGEFTVSAREGVGWKYKEGLQPGRGLDSSGSGGQRGNSLLRVVLLDPPTFPEGTRPGL